MKLIYYMLHDDQPIGTQVSTTKRFPWIWISTIRQDEINILFPDYEPQGFHLIQRASGRPSPLNKSITTVPV
ncbi:hypothetical protein GCM10010182_56710 [Actinomadura cremea]|nr:hypothetical protein GCM10010182_56710 [Actinomadura cremea]